MTSTADIDWSELLAQRARRMKPSALRQLLKATNRPGMISFAGGLPDPGLFPLNRIQAAVEAVLRRVGGKALQYGETEGVPELRDWIARRYSTDAMPLAPDNVLVTAGAQQSLDLAGRVLLEEGDRVIVENPTYMAALLAWQPMGAEFLPVPADAEGMDVSELEPLLAQSPKMAYVIPNFHNPTGATLALERRERLIDSLRGRNVALFEDDPYAALRYSGEAPASLMQLDSHPDDGGHVIQAGTFSKTLMPGLRVGWSIGPRVVIERMGRAKQATDLHTSTFNQHIALELVNTGYLEEYIPRLRAAYRERRDLMIAALQEHFPKGSRWKTPEGGMFIWIELPERIKAGELLMRALENHVAYVPGEEFHLDGSGSNTIRLNFTKTPPPLIPEGIQRLAEVLNRA